MKLFSAQLLRLKLLCNFSLNFLSGSILLIFVFSAFCPIIVAERLPVKSYTVADGLLRDTVYKIKQDSRGFLWFCTAEGISRFDGYGFANFTVADGLPGAAVNDFLETKQGEYLLATDAGIARLNPTGVRGAPDNPLFTIFSPDDPKAKSVRVLLEDENGEIWSGTDHGLYKLDKNYQFTNVPLNEKQPDGVSVTAIIKDRRGVLWLGTEGAGLFRLAPDGKTEQFTAADGLPGNLVASLTEDRDGNLWAGMRLPATAGLVLLNPNPDAQKAIVRRTFSTSDGLPSHWIPAMYQADDGKFWLGTIAGLCEWQGADAKSVCRTYTGENDLCDKDVWSVTGDKDGNLWTGSICGAKKLARYGFTAYGEADGIEKVKTDSIFENRAGELFASTKNNGNQTIYRFGDDGKFTAVRPNLPTEINYFSWGWNQTVRQDSAGAWLVPTSFGLFKFPAGMAFENLIFAAPQKFSPATKGTDIFRVFEDSRGDVWMATTFGGEELWRWERAANVWHDYTAQIIPAPHRLVSSFAEDRAGNLWIGTGADEGSELIRYRDGRFKVFTAADGLPDGWIRDLYVDGAGSLWIANARNGLFKLADVNADRLIFARYSTAEGLSGAGAYCVTEDAFGRIYVGGARGIDRLNPDTGQVENFTAADGLPSSQIEEAYRDRRNNLWFGTTGGLAKFVPEPERQRQPPTILISSLLVNGEPQSVSVLGEMKVSGIELNADQRQISINFLGLGASLGERLKYEYRLSGDSVWTPTTDRTLNFANLSGGNYRFEIRAVTADRLTSSPAVISFKIASPVYLRPWFLIAAFLFFGGFGFAVYRFRVSRLLEVERMRTRIATDLHDDIGANLTKISILSEVAHQRLTGANNFDDANLLENIAETSRESVSAMSDIVWAINPKKDSLADLTSRMRRYAEELLERREIKLDFHAPPSASDLKLDADLRRNIYLIFKESLNNIVRHAEAENVRIDFSFAGGTLILRIADDGRGFETDGEYDGNGLASMQKRAAELGGDLQIKSSPPNGTSINLRVESAKKNWTG